MIPESTDESSQLRRLYWYSFLARFGTGMLGWSLLYFSNLAFIADAAYYDRVAGSIADDWLNGRSSAWLELNMGNHGKPVLMVTVLACFYVLTLGVRALPVLIALYCLLTSWTPIWMYRVAACLGLTRQASLTAGRMVAFLPAFVFWSAALYKEGLIHLFMTILMYHGLRFQQTSRTIFLAGVIGCLVVIGLLRFYLFPLLGLTVLLGLLLPGRNASAGSLAGRLVLMVPLTIVIGAGAVGLVLSVDDPAPAVYGGWDEGTHDAIPLDLESAIRKLDVSRRDMATARSGYLPEVSFESVQDVLVFMPKGMLYFMTVPWPWQIGSVTQNLAVVDTAMWLLLFYPMFLAGLPRVAWNEPGGSFLLLAPAIAMCCLYSVFLGNIGTAYRMRIQLWLLMAPFVAAGWQMLKGHRPLATDVVSAPLLREERPWSAPMAPDAPEPEETPVQVEPRLLSFR